jgi:hypothetical protein
MAAPNIVNISALYGKTTYTNLTTTGSTSILSNANNSGKVLKINSLIAVNGDQSSAVGFTSNYYNSSSITAANASGSLGKGLSVPSKSNLIILDKNNALYLEENKSIGASATTAKRITVVCSYEEIS